MCGRVVELERLVVIDAVDRAVEPAEQHDGVSHLRAHRRSSDRKGLEGDVECRDAAPEIKRAFNALGGALDVNVRELFELAVAEEAVFISVAVVADAAGKAERKALTVDHAICSEPLIIVRTGLREAGFILVGAGVVFR